MQLLDLATVLVVLISVLAWINARVLRLPSTIGVTLGGLVVSLVVAAAARAGLPAATHIVDMLGAVDFGDFVFLGVLSFLLFAGAMGLDSRELWQLRWPVLIFALISTLVSTGLVAVFVHTVLGLLGHPVSWLHALLFGALISPTDPVAVLGMLKHAKVPNRVETIVAGESLFNDGVGVVIFTVIATLAGAGGHTGDMGAADVGVLFLREAVGGLALGVIAGLIGLTAIRHIDDYITEVVISLAVVLVLTAVAQHVVASAPLAAVAAGLFIGSVTDRRPTTLTRREHFEDFWHLVDEVLNVALFALLALEAVVVDFSRLALGAGLLAVPLVLLARLVSVKAPLVLLARWQEFDPHTGRLMVWGGLRGALAVAMALSLPASAPRELFLVMTYVVVVFSILVQGLTMGRLAEKAARAAKLLARL